MRKCRLLLLLLTAVTVCMMAVGCGENASKQDDAETFDAYIQDQKTAKGEWGEKFVTNRGYTYPFELYETLYECYAFNLKYKLLEVTDGTIYDTTMFKIFIRNTDGEWIGVQLFQLDENGEAFVNVILEYSMDIEAVAVMCQEDGVEFTHTFEMLDPG